MPRITAPDAAYEGKIGNVQFTDGQADTDDPAVLAYCRRHGYTIEDTAPEDDEQDGGEHSGEQGSGELTKPAKSARKAEWVDYAVARGHPRADAESLTVDDLHNLFDDDEG